MQESVFLGMTQLRVPVVAGAWTQIDLPPGAQDALCSVDGADTIPFRVSTDNTLAPATEGTLVGLNAAIRFPGTATAVVTFYVAPDANTVAQVLYQV